MATTKTVTRKRKKFDAARYLRKFNGRDYLEVKWRLLWLRTEHPQATVETELAKHLLPSRGEPGLALFRARVALPGGGEASGWGSETSTDFSDYIEKAETKALGRALAALGFGTQFCEDFESSARPGALPGKGGVDQHAATAGRPSRSANGGSGQARPPSPAALPGKGAAPAEEPPATPAQVKAIYAVARDYRSLSEADMETEVRARYGRPVAELTRREASALIDELKAGAAL